MIKIYKAIILPILEYASTVWSPSKVKQINRIERIQRKVTKFAFNWTSMYSYSERLEILKLPTLQWRRLHLDLLLTHKLVHGDEVYRKSLFILHSETGRPNLRRHRYAIYKSIFHLDIYRNHFVNRVVDVWNALPRGAGWRSG